MRSVAFLILSAFCMCTCNGAHQQQRGGEVGSGLPPEGAISEIPMGDLAGVASSNLVTKINNPYNKNASAIAQGHDLFLSMNCASCHGYDAKGGMGPDLTDTYWRFGGAPAQIYRSIYEGRSAGMPAWGKAIPASEIWKVVAYIQSLGGTVPAAFGQHGNQGDVPSEQAATDTAKTQTGKQQP
jgi:cytochrome c oxidase cbb3-type subunit 3